MEAVRSEEDRVAGLVIDEPTGQRLPVVLASPHSGREYPNNFLQQSRLDPSTLRRSEDSFVDELLAEAVQLGIPMVKALFPRAYVDANREPFELDPDMFADPLPTFVNSRSPRVAAGLGTIAKVVAQGVEIYGDKLSVEEGLNRIERHYRPYHASLKALIDRTIERFGYCILIDCHSMPSGGGPGDVTSPSRKASTKRTAPVDFVLGDCFGHSCAPILVERAEAWLKSNGYACTRNIPYAGGYTTRHYGRPRAGVHALQLEVNRSLYMDEQRFERRSGLNTLAQQLAELMVCLGQTDPKKMRGMRL